MSRTLSAKKVYEVLTESLGLGAGGKATVARALGFIPKYDIQQRIAKYRKQLWEQGLNAGEQKYADELAQDIKKAKDYRLALKVCLEKFKGINLYAGGRTVRAAQIKDAIEIVYVAGGKLKEALDVMRVGRDSVKILQDRGYPYRRLEGGDDPSESLKIRRLEGD